MMKSTSLSVVACLSGLLAVTTFGGAAKLKPVPADPDPVSIVVTPVEVVAPANDPRITFPVVSLVEPGKLLELRNAKGATTWTILTPGFVSAAPKDDQTLSVIGPPAGESVTLLAHSAGSFQVLVLTGKGEAPTPDPKPPTPPTPVPVPVDVPNAYGVGKASYEAASKVESANRAAEAAGVAKVFRDVVKELDEKPREMKVILPEVKAKAHQAQGSNQAAWQGWEATVWQKLEEGNRAGKIVSVAEWQGVFVEIAASLEAVR